MYCRNCILYETLIIKFLAFLFSTLTNRYGKFLNFFNIYKPLIYFVHVDDQAINITFSLSNFFDLFFHRAEDKTETFFNF